MAQAYPPTQTALLRAVFANPNDALRVQIYCDWLEDAGRGDLAEVIRAHPITALPALVALVRSLAEADRVDLCYLARRNRLTNPAGKFDRKGRWYPDEATEGGTPTVRFPSAAWPYSYMTACRTKKWCAQLPIASRDEDAAIALAAILARRITPAGRLAKLFWSLKPV